MTPQRFADLADAYGSDPRRWPAAEREAAQALLALGAPRELEVLRQAAQLDRLLDKHRVGVPDPALVRRIIASAPTASPDAFWAPLAGWLSRAGFIGAGLAGIAAGILVMSLNGPLPASNEGLPSIFDQGDSDIVLNLSAEEADQ